ncbi:hypothetical protein E2C01_011219 [Portunus trituberculatus]|uniref:Uncharacterized protein n=1 Tax=Portunus trituberculatus TaxID=210409 RepID=A0A5B7DAI9_PORTR|nr:hypothetical protein [Portunus trituberculatus]
MRKIELTMENSNSDTASDHSNTSSTPDRSSSGSSVKLPVLTRVIRTCRNAPSPQSKEARHSTSRQPSESEEKEQGKGATRQSTSSSDPIVISSTDSDKITKDNKSSEPKQQNNSLSHSEVDSEDADCSEILWKSEDVSVPLSRTQDKGNKREETMKQNASKENLEKRNEDLCAVLHDTSLEVQKLLNDRCFEDDIEESTTCEKTKHEQFSSLCKPFKTSEVTKETPESRRSNRKKRINFMAVNVSPSVVKDIKIAEQKPKVKITNDVKEPSQSIVVLSDSDENENGELPDLSKSVSEKKEKNLDKKQVMETTPHKVNAEEQVKGGITESSSSGVKRKRKLFNKEEIVETSTKKRKIEDITNSLSNSLEDSVTDIESSNSEGIVTRSGRKIVPPKKDMPEPMTPPKKAKKKLHQEADPSQAEETVRTSSSSLENSDICFDEGIESPLTEEQCSLENEMEVDHSSGDKVEVPEDEPKKCGKKTSEESIPMECGQDLEGEVSYPAARPGTEILDDSVSPEGEDQHKDTGAPGQVNTKESKPEKMDTSTDEAEENQGDNAPSEEMKVTGDTNVTAAEDAMDVEDDSGVSVNVLEELPEAHNNKQSEQENTVVNETQSDVLEDAQASSDTGRHELEKEAECKATTECMADTEAEVTSAAVMPCEALEEMAANTRQQEEELSPDKSSRSRLNLTVSTPERMKQRGALMHAGSRAALLVACAKKNIKNRGGGEGESSASILTGE